MPALPSSSSILLTLRELGPPIPASQATAHKPSTSSASSASSSSSTTPSHPLQHPPNNTNTCTTPACKALLGILIPMTIATLFLSCWLVARWWRAKKGLRSNERVRYHKTWVARKVWASGERLGLGRKSAFAEKKRSLDLDAEWVVDEKRNRVSVLEVVRGSDRDVQEGEGGKGRASSVYSRTTDGDVFPDDEEVQGVEQAHKKQQGVRGDWQERGQGIIRKMKAVRIGRRGI